MMFAKAILFDLDGVIVSTDQYHYEAWKQLADEENIPYSKEVNSLQRGVSRMESLEIMLRNTSKIYSDSEKLILAEKKNNIYIEKIKNIKPDDILDGVMDFLHLLKEKGVKCAVASSSKNAKAILSGIGLSDFFDAVADGTQITHSKPHPEVFLLAAKLTGALPSDCIVIEDANVGIQAAKSAGMRAIAIGAAYPNTEADITVKTMNELTLSERGEIIYA